MSTPTNDDFDPEPHDDDEPDGQPQRRDPVRAELRRLQKRVKELEPFQGRATTAERQLAIAKAGVKLDDPKAKYFLAGYDGELTTDAIKAAAVEVGLVDAAPAAPPEERQAAQRLDGLNSASSSVPRPGERDAEYENRMRAATSPGEALAIMQEFGKPIAGNNS